MTTVAGIKLLKINRSSYEYYVKNVNCNKLAKHSEVVKKLTRNLHCGLAYKISKGKTWYAYGNLRFAVKDDEVVWIENSHSAHPKWVKDMDKYGKLSKRLGLRKHVS